MFRKSPKYRVRNTGTEYRYMYAHSQCQDFEHALATLTK